jgi:hypothetical protein
MYFYTVIHSKTKYLKNSPMKKIILLSISIMMMSAVLAKGQNPIPSYNVPVSKTASFAEDTSTPGGNIQKDEKRDVNVTNGASGNRPIQGAPVLVVYIYRLDHSIVLGPFAVPYGETITVTIDDFRWGVYAETTAPTYMSVWTNDQM